MSNTETSIGEVLTTIKGKPYLFNVSFIVLGADSNDPLNQIPLIYSFVQSTPVYDDGRMRFVVKVTSALIKFNFKAIDNTLHNHVINFAIRMIKETPNNDQFVYTNAEYKRSVDTMHIDGSKMSKIILQYFYDVYSQLPDYGIGIPDLSDNFHYNKTEIERWLRNLYERKFLFKNSGFKRYPRWGVSMQTFRINPEQIDNIKSELGSSVIDLNINANQNRYFKLVDTQTEQMGEFVFVLMPFNQSEFPQEIFDIYKKSVKEILDINCVKVDNDNFKNFIENKIYTHIVKSLIVIAEISTENPNVVFEVGLSMALSKQLLLTCHNKYRSGEKKLSFDYSHFDTIFYDDSGELEKELKIALLPYKTDTR